VLELPEGAQASPAIDSDSIRVASGTHLYLFQSGTGKWTDIDTNAILDKTRGEESDPPNR
jgi:hypothetical protein